MKKGYIELVLHAHLPFVRHPEYPRFLEENWLFEAITETYLPLFRMCYNLKRDGVPFCITLSISPTLTAMLADPLLKERYAAHLERSIELGMKEVERTKGDEKQNRLAKFYLALYEKTLFEYNEIYRRDLIKAIRDLEADGLINLITNGGTHAFLPLYQEYPEAVQAQVETALMSHVSYFRKKPKGFWLPECGYYPGLEQILKRNDLTYFFTASHGIALANGKAERGIFAPVKCSNGVHAFARSFELSQAVWSGEDGYPADYVYRDFYRDVGYDLDMDYIGPYVHEPEVRAFTGYKYWAITGKTDKKELYDIDAAKKRTGEHAQNFLYSIRRSKSRTSDLIDREPCFVIPFDAELFGHWWFEGVDWLEQVIRGAAEDEELEMITPEQYLDIYPDNQQLQPAVSSWGNDGYCSVWIDGSNDWIYRHIHKCIERMIELVERFPGQESLKKRFLDHAAREVLLMMASDWPFIMSNSTTMNYAERRVREHIHNFNIVYDNLCRNTVDTEWLTRTEKKFSIFPDIDYQVFSRRKRNPL